MKVLKPSDLRPRFYAYKDNETNNYYFHNPISNECYWSVPSECDVFFADSMTPFFHADPPSLPFHLRMAFSGSFPGNCSERRSHSQYRSMAQGARMSRPRVSSTSTLSFLTAELRSPPTRDELVPLPVYFPLSIQTDRSLVDLGIFVKGHFRAVKKPVKKLNEIEDLSIADDNPARIPL
jgi:hypothetical protein